MKLLIVSLCVYFPFGSFCIVKIENKNSKTMSVSTTRNTGDDLNYRCFLSFMQFFDVIL